MKVVSKNIWFWTAVFLFIMNVGTLTCLFSKIEKRQEELKIRYFYPGQPADAKCSPEIIFNMPVVPKEEVGSEVDKKLVKIEPSIPGRFTWSDRYSIKFTPLNPIDAATEYNIVLSPDLKTSEGRRIGAEKVFHFEREHLKLLALSQANYSPSSGCEMLFSFNDKVSPLDLKKYLAIYPDNGKDKALDFEIQPGGPMTEIKVKVPPPLNAEKLNILISKGLSSESGPLGIEKDISRTLQLDPYFQISNMESRLEYWGDEARIVFTTTQYVSVTKLNGYVNIEPAIDLEIDEAYGNNYILNGEFKANTCYKVTIKKGLESNDGKVLLNDYTKHIYFKAFPPKVSFKTAGIYMRSAGAMKLPLETINKDEVKIEAYPLYSNNLIYFMKGDSRRYYETLSAQPVTKTVKVQGKTDEKVITYLDVKDFWGGRKCGVYMFRADDYKTQLVMVTDLGVSVKKAGKDFLVWVNSLSGTKPVPGADVAIYSRSNQKLLEGKTSADGIVHFSNYSLPPGELPFAVIVTKGDDLAFVKLEDAKLDLSGFEISGRNFLEEGCEAFVYSDRGIYRPGETVHLNAFARGGNISLPGKIPVTFNIYRPDEKLFKKQTSMMSEGGSAATDFEIPADARTGRYKAELIVPGTKKAAGELSFLVEEFLPDRIKATIESEDKRYKPGEELIFKVVAEYLFGSPLACQKVKAECYLKSRPFAPEAFKDYSFTSSSESFSPVTERLGNQNTAENGSSLFTYKIPENIKSSSPVCILISATAFDPNGRTVTGYMSRDLDCHPYYLGLKRMNSGYATVGNEEKFSFVTVSPDGKEVEPEDGSFRAELYKIKTNWVLKRNYDEYRYECVTDEQLVKAIDIATGKEHSFSLAVSSPGSYRVAITNSKSGLSSDVKFSCSAPWYDSWSGSSPDKLELQLDKEAYRSGTEAVLLVKSPVKGAALLTLEGDRVYAAIPFEMSGNSQELRFPVKAEYGSSFYCTVSALNKNANGRSFETLRAFGTLPLKVDRSDRQLKLALDAPAELRPGEKLKIMIDAGKPGKTYMTLAAVDEGICRLTTFQTPSPFDFFYGKKELGVESFDLYSLLMPEPEKENAGKDSRAGGDGYFKRGRMLNPIQGKRVRSVALWKGDLCTDANGKAEVEFTVPSDFTGELRIMAVAASGVDFGSAQLPVKIRQPLMVVSSFPRFLAPDDEFTLPVTVFNKTAANGTAEISLDAGKNVTETGHGDLNLTIAKDKNAQSFFNLRAPANPGCITVTANAKMGQESAFDKAEIPVRPPATLTAINGCGQVKAGESFTLKFPGGWLEGTEETRLACSSLPGVKLGKALGYVMHYPYGCIEQTTSSSFPLLYLADIATLVDPKFTDSEAVKDFVQSGITRILTMQTGNGAFSMWPGCDNSYPWGSVYATHFLVKAKEAGYDVPQDALDSAIGYLNTFVEQSAKESDFDITVKAYACYVLALIGKPNRIWTKTLIEWPEKLPSYSRSQLAVASFLMNEMKDAAQLSSIELPPKNTPRSTSGSLRSYVRDSAIILDAFLELDPDNVKVPLLVKQLSDSLESAQYFNTQENAFALMALGKYARFLKKRQYKFEAEIRADGKILASFKSPEQISLSPKDLAGKELEISVRGSGTLYYYWTVSGIPLKPNVKDSDSGIKVRRSYYTRDGKPCDPDNIPQGELVVVRLTLESKYKHKNIAVCDLLPAGLEIENPKLSTTEKVVPSEVLNSGKKILLLEPDRVEARDDRFLLFTDVPEGASTYSYLARAVTKGHFVLPPVSAMSMYDPEISSTSGAGRISIGK